jgi:hypothetical protein
MAMASWNEEKILKDDETIVSLKGMVIIDNDM